MAEPKGSGLRLFPGGESSSVGFADRTTSSNGDGLGEILDVLRAGHAAVYGIPKAEYSGECDMSDEDETCKFMNLPGCQGRNGPPWP